MKFRKKPVEIEARPWFKDGDLSTVTKFRQPGFSSTEPCKHCGVPLHHHGWIDTLEGGHIVCPGDWVITGVAGENYPCKPSIFEQTYEPVP